MTNEEKYRATEERVWAFRVWRKGRCGDLAISCDGCKIRGVCDGDDAKFAHWLTLEAEEAKPEPRSARRPAKARWPMASESRETVADVVRELRTWGRVDVSCVGRDILRRDAERFADRIEAAHKREVATKDGERKGVLKANESLAADNTRLRGEVADLRRRPKVAEVALEKLLEIVGNVGEYISMDVETMNKVEDAKNALAAIREEK